MSVSGETSAEMTAEIDGQTGTGSTGESETAKAADAPSRSTAASHVNGQTAAEETADVAAPAPPEVVTEASTVEAPAPAGSRC